jgi:hypothetical protein
LFFATVEGWGWGKKVNWMRKRLGLVVLVLLVIAALLTQTLLEAVDDHRNGSQLIAAPLARHNDLPSKIAPSQGDFLVRSPPYSDQRFVYVVKSTGDSRSMFLREIERTWGRFASIAFVATDETPPGLDDAQRSQPFRPRASPTGLAVLPCGEGKGDAVKTYRAIQALCPRADNESFFVLVEESSFVVVFNVEKTISLAFRADEPLYAGSTLFSGDTHLVGGGGGVVLSRRTLRDFCDAAERPDTSVSECRVGAVAHQPGDVALARCLAQLHAQSNGTRGALATHIDGMSLLGIDDVVAPPGRPTNCGVDWIPKHHHCSPPPSVLLTLKIGREDLPIFTEVAYMVFRHDTLRTAREERFVEAWKRHIASDVRSRRNSRVVEKSPDDTVRFTRYKPHVAAAGREVNVAYTVLTTHEQHGTRLLALLTSWGKYANIPFLVSDSDERPAEFLTNLGLEEHSRNVPILRLGERGRHELGKKTLRGLAELCKVDAEFFVFADDDTFVVVPNLEGELGLRFSASAPLFLGSALTHLEHPIGSGGAGMVFSNATMRRFCQRTETSESLCSHLNPRVQGQPGDVAASLCMVELGVDITHSDGFHPLPMGSSTNADDPNCGVWWIPKAHRCRPAISRSVTWHYTDQRRFALYEYFMFHFVGLSEMIPDQEVMDAREGT